MSGSWDRAYRADRRGAALADRSYPRQSVGSPQFVPPGRCLVLRHGSEAVWVTSWPLAKYTKHAWPGAWVNSLFHKECDCCLASEMIREAVAHTLAEWPTVPDLGMVTFIDASKVRHKRDPGRCYLKAGFRKVGSTAGGLVALQMPPADMPDPVQAPGTQMTLLVP